MSWVEGEWESLESGRKEDESAWRVEGKVWRAQRSLREGRLRMGRVGEVQRSPKIPCMVHFQRRTGTKMGAGHRTTTPAVIGHRSGCWYPQAAGHWSLVIGWVGANSDFWCLILFFFNFFFLHRKILLRSYTRGFCKFSLIAGSARKHSIVITVLEIQVYLLSHSIHLWVASQVENSCSM